MATFSGGLRPVPSGASMNRRCKCSRRLCLLRQCWEMLAPEILCYMRCEVLIRSLASWDGGFAVDDYILYRLRFDV